MPSPQSISENNNIIVQKYGGATLATPEKILAVAKRIFKLHQSGKKVVVIVSAMGQTTNQLIELAHQVSQRPPLRELDMLLSVGERISMSLLSMALNEIGCPAISFTGSQAGILTDDSHVSANIIDVKAFRVEAALNDNRVVILAGFQGVSAQTKEITTLGRGGSDISAVAIAGYLNAERCEILKDVDAIFTADPKIINSAMPIHQLSYSQLLDMTQWGAKVLNFRSVKLAYEKNVKLYVGSATAENSAGTFIENEFENQKQTLIALNSFTTVFKLSIKNTQFTFDDFQNFLQNQQIGQVQLLKQINENFYFTAPEEILNSILKLPQLPTPTLLESSELASVSATYTQTCQASELQTLLASLNSNKLTPEYAFTNGCSAHIFIKSEWRIGSIKILHQLYLS